MSVIKRERMLLLGLLKPFSKRVLRFYSLVLRLVGLPRTVEDLIKRSFRKKNSFLLVVLVVSGRRVDRFGRENNAAGVWFDSGFCCCRTKAPFCKTIQPSIFKLRRNIPGCSALGYLWFDIIIAAEMVAARFNLYHVLWKSLFCQCGFTRTFRTTKQNLQSLGRSLYFRYLPVWSQMVYFNNSVQVQEFKRPQIV